MSSCVISSPFGDMQLEASSRGLTALTLLDKSGTVSKDIPLTLQATVAQLAEYFAGDRTVFDLRIDYSGLPAFQVEVLKVVRTIPYGRTRTYAQIARHLDNPKAARAVGRANGSNPLPIIIPCHRVIGAKGALTGYALGLPMKKQLLCLENPTTYQPQINLFDLPKEARA